MIELEQIKKTDPIKALRGQLNTSNMFEIRAYVAVTVPIEVGNQAISLTF